MHFTHSSCAIGSRQASVCSFRDVNNKENTSDCYRLSRVQTLLGGISKSRNRLLAVSSIIFPMLLLSSVAGAAENYLPSSSSAWYVGLGQVTIDKATADTEGIKDKATYFRAAWEGQSESILYGLGISGYFYSDHAEFSQRVEDSFGNQSTADSSADSFNIYGETGINYALSRTVTMDFLGGYEMVVQSSRSISNCSNCYSEDIEVDAGVYLSPRIRFQADNGFTMSLQYHQFLTGDVEGAIAINMGLTRF